MRYLHVIHSLDPAQGGPSGAVAQLSRAATRLGHQVEIATLDTLNAPGVDRQACPVHCFGPALGKYRYSPRLVPWLRENAARFDAVVTSGLWQYHGFAVWRALHKTQTPYFVFTHGMLDPWFKRRYPLKHLKKWLYWPWADYRVLRDARAVFFTSEQEKLDARQSFWLYEANEVVVNYGTAGPTGDGAILRSLFLREFPQLSGKRVLLFLSRIHPKKGIDLLLEAFAALPHRDPDLHLVLAGPDQLGMQPAWKVRASQLGIADHVTWTGMLDGDLKWGAFYAAEAFVLPSHQENFGIAVAEALACGTPVLISNKVNIWREIDADKAGLIAEDTLHGTIGLLNRWTRLRPAERLQFAANARACFANRFRISAAAKSLVANMEKFCSHAHSDPLQDLSAFRLPKNFRGRPGWMVQLWWIVQATLFGLSPQMFFGWRRFLLRLFGARVGRNVLIRPTARVTYPWKVRIGDNAWIGDEVVLYSLGEIEIGDNCVVSQRSYVCAASHDYRDPSFPIHADPVVIEPEVWLATDVFVAPGVRVGRGTVVGARSSVFDELPPNVVAIGTPAVVVRERSARAPAEEAVDVLQRRQA